MDAVDKSFQSLPLLYTGFLGIWILMALLWVGNIFRNRHVQKNKLQWLLASIPLVKAMQLCSLSLFWYSCINLEMCSLWMSFGAYVTGILFQTVSYLSFLLISHGYCITCERLSVSERRATAVLGLFLYLTLVGFKGSLPYSTVVMVLYYVVSFCVIFHYISRNLRTLREQLTYIEGDNARSMYDAVQLKYTMIKKFQIAMLVVALTEIAMHITFDNAKEYYGLRILIREWAQFCIFLYIGWIFRSRALSSHFFVIPSLKPKGGKNLIPIYSIEVNERDFKDLTSQAWQVGVPTPFESDGHGKPASDTILIIVQHPTFSSKTNGNTWVQ